ncbi:hypothetical protein ES707_13407 [subsurface metagenome]
MNLFNKKIKATIAAASPERFGSIAASCRKSADKMREMANLVTEAGKAYDEGDPVKGYALLQKAEESAAVK